MKGLILAAGRGSRMGQMTIDAPKCLVQLAGKSLLDWQIEAYKACDIHELAIVRGYQAQTINRSGIVYFQNPEWNNTNMVQTLFCASEWLDTSDCIVSYSDIVYSSSAVKNLSGIDADIAITYDPNWFNLWNARFEEPLLDAETFLIDKNNKLLEIGNRASIIDEIMGQYMGLLKFSKNGWENIKDIKKKAGDEELKKMDMTSLLMRMIKEGINIYVTPIEEQWYEVDNENDLRAYQKHIMNSEGNLWTKI